jgi:hypothetical protein
MKNNSTKDINYWKQLLFILADEVNVHNVNFPVGVDENGSEIELEYNKDDDDIYWVHANVKKEIKKPERVCLILRNIFNQWNNKQQLNKQHNLSQ